MSPEALQRALTHARNELVQAQFERVVFKKLEALVDRGNVETAQWVARMVHGEESKP